MKYEYEVRCIDILKNHSSIPIGGNRVIYNPTENYTAYHDWHETELAEQIDVLACEGWEVVTIDQNLLSGKSLAGNVLLKRPVKE